MKSKINWSGINWKRKQDIVISRQLRKFRLTKKGWRVEKRRGKVVHPSRERVRQKRMEIYLAALKRALRLPEREGEQDVRASLAWALTRTGARQARLLGEIQGMESALNSPLRKALAEASKIYRPVGWHGREGTTKTRIAVLPTEKMTVREIADKVGCGVSYVSQALKDLGRSWKASHRGREEYNWKRFFPYNKDGRVLRGKAGRWQEVSDRKIARALRVKNPMVVTQYRNRNKFRRRVVEVEQVRI